MKKVFGSGDRRVQRLTTAKLADSFLGQLREGERFTAFLRSAGSALAGRYRAREIVLAVCHAKEARGFLWRCRSNPATGVSPFEYSESTFAEMAPYFSRPRGDWLLARVRECTDVRQRWRFLLRVTGQTSLPPGVLKLAGAVAGRAPLLRLIAVEIPPAGDSTGRLFLVNPSAVGGEPRTLRSVASLAREVGPAVLAQHETRVLRARMQMAERRRIARELHDGVIQSLLGLKVRVQVLRRQAVHAATVSELDDIERQLHQQVIALRELGEGRPATLDSSQLLTHLASHVERFRRETRIAAVFLSDIDKVRMSSWMCREVVRVVQEALANIRRHSGAASAEVRVSAREGCLALNINDDGRGFPFTGRHLLDELERMHQGPLVIKERVRALGGALTIESTPLGGARLEIQIPMTSTHAVS